MRNISFALTRDHVRNRTQTVTRRIGWTFLKVGVLQPIVKGQGIKQGEHVEKIGGPIRVVSVRREPLWRRRQYSRDEAAREGFPQWGFREFADFYAEVNRCGLRDKVTRIEFEYTERQ